MSSSILRRTENVAQQPQTRYSAGRFPAQITSREIDDSLLNFWSASRTGDPARRFLYSYRIIEYASFSYLELNCRISVRKLLAARNALDDLVTLAERVMNAVQETKLSDVQKLEALLKETVDPALLWREVARNLAAFTTEVRFDGGFTLSGIARVGWKEEDFAVNGISSFAGAIRNIRNALSHGRDLRTSAVITPTAHNFERLQPWTSLIAVAAAEVMVYRDAG